MSINPELLKLLVCPETKQSVKPAEDSFIEKVNLYISSGEVVNKSGSRVDYTLTGGLITEDGKTLYPIRDDIPVMLAGEALPVDQFKKQVGSRKRVSR